MARYDRIARLPPPEREGAFPGWLTLRDLEGREREPELGRRARLRFLALRPIQRLLRQGLNGPTAESFQRQIDAIREELGQLPNRDRERQRLSDYLKEIGGRAPRGMVIATLDVGAAAEAAGHRFAAEEFYRTALEMAAAHSLTEQRMLALRRLARVHRDRREYDAARPLLEEAASLADDAHDALAWARAMEGLAILAQRQGNRAGAREVLERIAQRGARERDDRLISRAAAGRCALALAEGDLERAAQDGWNAVRMMDSAEEDRNAVLLNLAAALRRLGLHEAAGSAYGIVARWAAWPEHRIEAQAEQAVVAAEAGDEERFRSLRSSLMDSLDRTDPHLTALVELALGRAAMRIGDVDDSREHLRRAIATARDADLDGMLKRAEELLSALESQGTPADTPAIRVTPVARTIAEQLLELGRELVPTG